MKKGILFVVLIISAAMLGGCKPDLGKYSGNYQFIKKIDAVDKSETLYKKGDARYQKGYLISVDGENLIATPSQINADGKAEKSARGSVLTLVRTDEGIFQYKKSDGSLVLTFHFIETGINILEFQKDKYGNFQQESTLELKK